MTRNLPHNLPTGCFKQLSRDQINKIHVDRIPKGNAEGFILEVDFEYPEELSTFDKDYTFAREKIGIKERMLSGYCKKFTNKHNNLVGARKNFSPNLG